MFISTGINDQCGDLTSKEQVRTVFIPTEAVMEDGVDMAWLVVAESLEDAKGTKDDCWSKDTRWAYWSWVKPVWEIAEEPAATPGESQTPSEVTTLVKGVPLLALGKPCFL